MCQDWSTAASKIDLLAATWPATAAAIRGRSRSLYMNIIYLVKLEWRRGGVVKNGQKLKKGSFSPIKTLTREMSPIGMKQETRKKN